MKTSAHKDLAYYMALDYPVTIWWDEEDKVWYAQIPLLPGLTTHAEKREDLDAMIEDAKRGYIEVSLKFGDPIAEPERTRA